MAFDLGLENKVVVITLPVALAAVFDLHQRIDHFVNMAAVFGQKKLPSFIIIIFLHNFCGSSVALLLRTVPITF